MTVVLLFSVLKDMMCIYSILIHLNTSAKFYWLVQWPQLLQRNLSKLDLALSWPSGLPYFVPALLFSIHNFLSLPSPCVFMFKYYLVIKARTIERWNPFFSCPFLRFSSCLLHLCLCLMSFLLFPCASVRENTCAWCVRVNKCVRLNKCESREHIFSSHTKWKLLFSLGESDKLWKRRRY